MRGRKNYKKPPTSNILPPCKVCGEPGTGFHYGVTTCGACKGFFRRSLTRDDPYECIQSQACFVGPCTDRRQTCPKCRLEKCFAVGMCKEACKVGRYSLIKKSKDIEEVMKLQDAPRPIPPPMNAYGWQPGYPQTTNGMAPFPTPPLNLPHNPHYINSIQGTNVFNDPIPNNGLYRPSNDHYSREHIYDLYHDKDTGYQLHKIGDIARIQYYADPESSKNTENNLRSEFNSLNPVPISPSNQLHTSSYNDNILTTPSLHPSLPSTTDSNSQPNIPNDIITSELVANSMEIISDPSCNFNIPPYSDKYECHSDSSDTILDTFENNESGPRPPYINFLEGKSSDDYSTHKNHSMEIMMPTSSTQIGIETSDSLASESKDNSGENGAKPVMLCVVDPDPLKCVLSIFERFPFKSYEKESIAPLLKLCYNRNEWLDEYIPESGIQQKGIITPDINRQLESQQQSVTSTIYLDAIMSSEHVSEVPLPASKMVYDAKEMSDLFDQLKAAHDRYWGPESDYLSPSESSMYLELFQKICKLQESLQGSMNLLDDDKYYTVLKTTGVDVDKRKAWFACTFANFDESLTKDSKFFLALPGFKEFSVSDRIAMTRSTTMLHSGLKHSQSVDLDAGVVIDQDRRIATSISNFMKIVPGTAHVAPLWTLMLKRVKQLKISFDEFIVLKALVILLPEYCKKVEDKERVIRLHNTYLKCLLCLIRKTHGSNADERFIKFIGILETLSGMRDKVFESRNAMLHAVSALVDDEEQPLLKEVLGTAPCY